MSQELFDQQLAISLQRLEELWQQADQMPKPHRELWRQTDEFPNPQQELLIESLHELSNSLAELQTAAEELRQQNEELVESRLAVEKERQRYQELFEFAPDGYFVTTPEAVIQEANQATAELLNVSQSRLVGKPLIVFIDAEQRQNFYSHLRQLQRGESIKNWQLHIQRRRGAVVPVSLTVAPVQNPQKQVVGLRWRMQELSLAAKKESTRQQCVSVSQDALQEHQLLYAMFENVPVGIALLDSQGQVIKSNRALQEMLDCTSEDLQTVIPKLMNLNKAGVESMLFQELIMRQCRSYQLEKRILAQDSLPQWGRLTVSRVQGAQTDPTFATCMLEDITELRQLEASQQQAIEQLEVRIEEPTPTSTQLIKTLSQQLTEATGPLGKVINDILSSSPDFFFIYDRAGKYIYVNRTAAQALGLAQTDFIGKTWRQLGFPTEMMEPFEAQREAVFTTGQPFTDKASFPTVDGVRDYQYTLTRISEINSGLEVVVATLKDITEQNRAAVIANVALAKEKEFSGLKSNFAGTVSQELRNPLNNILSCAKLLERNTQQKIDKKKQSYLQLIQVNVKRINQLLDDLLLIGKLEAGELQLNPALLDLTAFCRELTEELQLGAGREHRIKFISQGRCAGVCMDEKLLRHILTNLLLKAIKYSPKGSEVQLNIACHGEQAIFRLQHLDISIPQKDQVELSSVKQCVDLQRGEICVENEVGVGTICTVTLPLNQRVGKRG